MQPFAKRSLVALFLGLTTLPASSALAESIENLERERARLISVMQDAGITAEERQTRIEGLARRLRDLERMAMRDDSLVGRNTPVIRQAFADYDLTFLVHAAGEDGVTLGEKWMARVGISTDKLLAARAGRR